MDDDQQSQTRASKGRIKAVSEVGHHRRRHKGAEREKAQEWVDVGGRATECDALRPQACRVGGIEEGEGGVMGDGPHGPAEHSN